MDLGLGLNVDLDLKFRIQNFENHVVKSLWFASKKSFGHLKFLKAIIDVQFSSFSI